MGTCCYTFKSNTSIWNTTCICTKQRLWTWISIFPFNYSKYSPLQREESWSKGCGCSCTLTFGYFIKNWYTGCTKAVTLLRVIGARTMRVWVYMSICKYLCGFVMSLTEVPSVKVYLAILHPLSRIIQFRLACNITIKQKQ